MGLSNSIPSALDASFVSFLERLAAEPAEGQAFPERLPEQRRSGRFAAAPQTAAPHSVVAHSWPNEPLLPAMPDSDREASATSAGKAAKPKERKRRLKAEPLAAAAAAESGVPNGGMGEQALREVPRATKPEAKPEAQANVSPVAGSSPSSATKAYSRPEARLEDRPEARPVQPLQPIQDVVPPLEGNWVQQRLRPRPQNPLPSPFAFRSARNSRRSALAATATARAARALDTTEAADGDDGDMETLGQSRVAMAAKPDTKPVAAAMAAPTPVQPGLRSVIRSEIGPKIGPRADAPVFPIDPDPHPDTPNYPNYANYPHADTWPGSLGKTALADLSGPSDVLDMSDGPDMGEKPLTRDRRGESATENARDSLDARKFHDFEQDRYAAGPAAADGLDFAIESIESIESMGGEDFENPDWRANGLESESSSSFESSFESNLDAIFETATDTYRPSRADAVKSAGRPEPAAAGAYRPNPQVGPKDRNRPDGPDNPDSPDNPDRPDRPDRSTTTRGPVGQSRLKPAGQNMAESVGKSDWQPARQPQQTATGHSRGREASAPSQAAVSGTPASRSAYRAEQERKATMISIRVSEGESEQLRRRAEEAGMTLSAYLRSCAVEADHLRAQVKQALAEMRAIQNQNQPPLRAARSAPAADLRPAPAGFGARLTAWLWGRPLPS